MSVTDVIDALRQHGLVTPLPDNSIVRERERTHEGDVFNARTLGPQDASVLAPDPGPSRRRSNNPAAISDLLDVSEEVEVPPEGEISTKGWDEEEQGVEAWAWYRSFHWDRVDRWGIYLADEGIWRLADRLLGTGLLPAMQAPDLVRLSTDILLWHESFHFLTDIAAAALELSAADPVPLYLPYVEMLARTISPGHPSEEALANAFASMKMRPASARKAAHAVFKDQPDGYRDFGRYRGRAFGPGLRGLLQEISRKTPGLSGTAPHEVLFDIDMRQYGLRDVPVWLVERLGGSPYALSFIDSIDADALLETDKYRKDVQRLPRPVRAKLVRALSQLADTTRPGLQFKPLKNCGGTWSIRVGGDHRAALRRTTSGWELLRVLPRGKIYQEVCR